MQNAWGILGCGDIVRKRVARAILDEPRSRLIAANPEERCSLPRLDHSLTQFLQLVRRAARENLPEGRLS